MDPGTSEQAPLDRPTARVILRAPDRSVLLLRGTGTFVRAVWFAPGGGVHEGESLRECAVREVYEETSQRIEDLRGPLWRRAHVWRSAQGIWYRSRERFFVCDVPARFEPRFADPNDPEQHEIGTFRWWTPEAIAASDETFAPRRLATLLPALDAPTERTQEIDVGI